jgi:cell wall-associated NlpC family hydrolase
VISRSGIVELPREAVVKEARDFMGTMYHHMGRIKISRDAEGNILDRGAVDCAQILYLVYSNLGLIELPPLEVYPPDWNMHRSAERYMEKVFGYAHEVETPLPGDVVLYKFGRCFAHGGIVTEWPYIVHAYAKAGCVLEDNGLQGRLADREMKFFSYWQDTVGSK